MIERVHEHLIGELKQNTRTDTIFIVVAILLNISILGTNSVVGSDDPTTYVPQESLVEGSHTLYVEVRDDAHDWYPAGSAQVIIGYVQDDGRYVPRVFPANPGALNEWGVYRESTDVRYKLDDANWENWAEHTESDSGRVVQTLVMFIFIVASIVVNLAVIFGLLRGKRMRLTILNGLMTMYQDQQVNGYYDESLLKSYSVRYHIFITVVVLVGVISIAVPLIIRYL